MARKKGGGHGGGHGWFVTFADLMALMMSFFVMLTAMSTQDQKSLSSSPVHFVMLSASRANAVWLA